VAGLPQLAVGSSIVISEDFPRDVMLRRGHLIKFAKQVRRRRPDTRLNLQYDKLYVNNVAYCYNEDTEEIELVNQADGDSETVMKAAGTKKNRRDYPTPKLKRKNYLSKSNSSDAVTNIGGSPSKEFYMDPMLEAALDLDSEDEEDEEERV